MEILKKTFAINNCIINVFKTLRIEKYNLNYKLVEKRVNDKLSSIIVSKNIYINLINQIYIYNYVCKDYVMNEEELKKLYDILEKKYIDYFFDNRNEKISEFLYSKYKIKIDTNFSLWESELIIDLFCEVRNYYIILTTITGNPPPKYFPPLPEYENEDILPRYEEII
jgi:hypothetical protein